MKFYIDFEATQFSERIISIGCVAENGRAFSTLVNPSGHKIGKFVTELTGITEEMVKDAPSPDEAFMNLFTWVVANCEGTQRPVFICYGNSDAMFIERTIHDMKHTVAITFAMAIKGNLVDFSTEVCAFFNMSTIGLQRVYNLMQAENETQRHDALEDAKMLMFVEQNMKIQCKPEDKVNMPASTHAQKKKKKAPAIFAEWATGASNKYNADTRADETNYEIMFKAKNNKHGVKYFDSMETAILWAIKYCVQGVSPRRDQDIARVRKHIENSIKQSCNYGGGAWFKNSDKEVVEIV